MRVRIFILFIFLCALFYFEIRSSLKHVFFSGDVFIIFGNSGIVFFSYLSVQTHGAWALKHRRLCVYYEHVCHVALTVFVRQKHAVCKWTPSILMLYTLQACVLILFKPKLKIKINPSAASHSALYYGHVLLHTIWVKKRTRALHALLIRSSFAPFAFVIWVIKAHLNYLQLLCEEN